MSELHELRRNTLQVPAVTTWTSQTMLCTRHFLSLFLLAAFLLPTHRTLWAQQRQKFSITSFERTPTDLTARREPYAKKDANGALYAIVKVSADNPDDDLTAYRFNFGDYIEDSVTVHDDQLWIYVQQRAKLVTITREGYLPVRNYALPAGGLEAGTVYAMQLSATVRPVIKQWVRFHITPAGSLATVLVQSQREGAAEETIGVTDSQGDVAKALELGSYIYRILSADYAETTGAFVLNDPNNTLVEQVALKPNFAEVTLSVDADAEIVVDGENKGRRTWKGALHYGTYTVACRQERHRPAT